MRILRDHHGLLEVMAFDDSGRLTLTMLLGRPAPAQAVERGRRLTLLVDGELAPSHLSLCFRRSRSMRSCSPSATRMRSMRARAACAGAGHPRSCAAGHRAGAPCGVALSRRILCRRDDRAVRAAASINAGRSLRVLLCTIRQPSKLMMLTINALIL